MDHVDQTIQEAITLFREDLRGERVNETALATRIGNALRQANLVADTEGPMTEAEVKALAMERWIKETVSKEWALWEWWVKQDACYICLDKNNHWGVPHSEAMRDGMTRAKADEAQTRSGDGGADA